MKKFSPSMVVAILVVIVGLWLASGIYTLKSDGGEQAVITRFGEYVRTEDEPGLKWKFPSPVEKIYVIQADISRSIEMGFRTVSVGSTTSYSEYTSIPEESLMITGDKNLVNTETVIQYTINDVTAYFFKVDDQEETLRIATESIIRRVVASHTMDDVLTDQKDVIQNEIMEELQELSTFYGLGYKIEKVVLQSVYAPEEVEEAFNDVLRAREDKNKYINEAEKERNEIVPAAEGNAAEMLNEAEAYKEKRISEAKGDVENFKQVLEKYKLGEEVTRTRMYLETMQQILPNAEIFIMDTESGDTVKFLPLADSASSTTDVTYQSVAAAAAVTDDTSEGGDGNE